MKEFINKKMGIILISFALICLYVQTGFASDNLLLNGVLQSIDKGNGLVTFNIMTEGCTGVRAFKMPDSAKSDLDDSMIGMNLQFIIDSSTCEKGKIYSVIIKEKP
jgi:hypothetical protein